jgi:ABC-2 type transport system permease protein
VKTFALTFSHLALRHLRTTARIPIFVALTLFQPMVWLLLYGQLFHKAVQIPGFAATSYITFLAPGVAVMSALFGSIWSGMGTVGDIKEGVIDRYLTTPASRLGIILSRLAIAALQVAVQTVIIVLIAAIVGSTPGGGIPGAALVVAAAALLACGFGAFSFGVAMLARREETMIGVANFVTLPLTFMSAIFIARNLMPHWMQIGADANPLQWAVTAARGSLNSSPDWAAVAGYGLLLAGFATATTAFAMWSFVRYQRTL